MSSRIEGITPTAASPIGTATTPINGYNTNQWFDLCRGQCEDNQPAQYRVRRNSILYLKPGFWMRNTGGPTDALVFNGEPSQMTEFYHRAPFGDVRVKILDGATKVHGGGEVCFQ